MDKPVKPVICFFENDMFIYSTEYALLTCSQDQEITDFLNDIEIKYENAMKIIQLNFDAYATTPPTGQKLYPSFKACVYILKHFSECTLREIMMKHTNLLRDSSNVLNETQFQLMTTKNEFIKNVTRAQEMIAAGRVYQLNLTTFFQASVKSSAELDSLQFFLLMNSRFAGSYKAYLPLPDYSVISFSPELFLEKKQNILKTSPIKGSLASTQNTELGLMKNEKENAELSMIVDLLRNDLNSLETETSAVVASHRQLMDLTYIQHTYSEVQIATSKNLPQVLRQTMPGGSISGCPKVESLIAISELENHQRHAYTGSIGWWRGKEFKLNIAIRSFVQTEDKYYYFAGCGIVYDSDPEKEFLELINKAGSLNVQFN
ncbi:MAG: hypothetical protein A2622_09120 [Bdellovibrionales bacterium RIFCSPHIGHO2_01_FULL_40_29]|nr:MAG: hypothetical protein A2622_09120 [Bdellovibrionales bacterium RIFCSPHIGHO2_01_FULL_40_29]OFZ32892.1 MAG: hypothetical protein A3D17_09330 [Bdellovibrionales bacterium RIFCSPHIGHO2_02_FULL_40_15]